MHPHIVAVEASNSSCLAWTYIKRTAASLQISAYLRNGGAIIGSFHLAMAEAHKSVQYAHLGRDLAQPKQSQLKKVESHGGLYKIGNEPVQRVAASAME